MLIKAEWTAINLLVDGTDPRETFDSDLSRERYSTHAELATAVMSLPTDGTRSRRADGPPLSKNTLTHAERTAVALLEDGFAAAEHWAGLREAVDLPVAAGAALAGVHLPRVSAGVHDAAGGATRPMRVAPRW